MSTPNDKEKLEQQLKDATPDEREQIAKRLTEKTGREAAETRPRGKDAETR